MTTRVSNADVVTRIHVYTFYQDFVWSGQDKTVFHGQIRRKLSFRTMKSMALGYTLVVVFLPGEIWRPFGNVVCFRAIVRRLTLD